MSGTSLLLFTFFSYYFREQEVEITTDRHEGNRGFESSFDWPSGRLRFGIRTTRDLIYRMAVRRLAAGSDFGIILQTYYFPFFFQNRVELRKIPVPCVSSVNACQYITFENIFLLISKSLPTGPQDASKYMILVAEKL